MKNTEENLTREIGERLKERLAAKGWKPTHLYVATDKVVTVQAICNYISGTRRMSIETSKIIAKALGNTSSAYLMTHEDQPVPPLPPEEGALLDNYKASDERGKSSIRRIAEQERLSSQGVSEDDEPPQEKMSRR